MIRKSFAPFFIVTFFMVTGIPVRSVWAKANAPDETMLLYDQLSVKNPFMMPSEEAFTIAYKGYTALKAIPGTVKKDLITIIDFSLPSKEKRLWIIELNSGKVLFHDFVAHGRNTGEDVAASFSNISGSYMSSLGFYVTGETYPGKHGLSLRLEGMDGEFNSNARSRAIVMHGASYVNSGFIEKYGRLGRSLGCPSVSTEIHEEVINTIKGASVLFIYYPDPEFLKSSQVLNREVGQPV